MDVRDKQSLPLSANQHVDFVAIDFETATSDPNSACAVGLAFVVGLRVVATTHHLIQPPGNRYDQATFMSTEFTRRTRNTPRIFSPSGRSCIPSWPAKPSSRTNARFDMSVIKASLALRRPYVPAIRRF